MNANEALEQVRALHAEEHTSTADEVWGRPGVCAECRVSFPCPTIAILDAVAPDDVPSESEYREAYEGWRAEGQRLHSALLTIWRGLGEDREHATFGDDPQVVVDEWIASRRTAVTPAEALEQVRARVGAWESEGLGYVPGIEHTNYPQAWADVLAILDAVTPDAPVTVEREALDLAARALGYHYDSHPIYGSTAACGGGIGGSVMTAHCTVLCESPKHDKVRDEFLKLRAEYDALVARATPERTEQEREAEVKHDPRAHAKVGDRASSNARVICEAISAEGYKCTRKEGHPGHHIAEGTRAVVAVWGARGREVSE